MVRGPIARRERRGGRARRALLLAGALGLGSACARQLPPVDRVVLVTLDTLRADHLSCYGYPRPTAPFLARLAAEGIVFENAFTASAHTGPSHASLLTSLFPYQHQLLVNGAPLAPETLQLGRLFLDAGYDTAGVVAVRFLKELRAGFRHFEVAAPVRLEEKVRYDGQAVLEAALRWLEGQPRQARFLLWLHFYDVHEWSQPDEHTRRSVVEVRSGTELAPPALLAHLSGAQGLRPEAFAERGLELLRSVDEYDGRIRYVDGLLEQLFESVQGSFDGRSLWVVTSDHGEGLGAHGYLGHGKQHYQAELRVPLLFSFSDGWLRGRRVGELVRLVDLLPTLAELIGRPLDREAARVEGRSLLPLLLGDPGGFPVRHSFAERRPAREMRGWAGELYSLHGLEHKYVAASASGDEFYDLRADPLETASRMDGPSPARDELRRLLLERVAAARSAHAASAAGARATPEHEAELRALGYLD